MAVLQIQPSIIIRVSSNPIMGWLKGRILNLFEGVRDTYKLLVDDY